MNNNELKNLAISLVKAETESEVVAIKEEESYDNEKYWRALGIMKIIFLQVTNKNLWSCVGWKIN